MGDRSYIVIESESFQTPVTFYGHSSGTNNVVAVENVLARTGRIGDAMYLTAQIFNEFAINLGKYNGETSFGIDACGYLDGNEWANNDTIYVNADTGKTQIEQPFNICGKKLVG
jgi:hypothetical protein